MSNKKVREFEDVLRFAEMCPDSDVRAGAYHIARDFTALKALAQRLHRLDECRCNGDLADGVWSRRTNSAMRKVSMICVLYALSCYHQSDPRGASLYIGCEPLTDSNYSSEAMAL